MDIIKKTHETALVVLNLQNQFVNAKGCLYYPVTGEVMPAILDGIRRLRDRGVYIVYANSETTGGEPSLDTEVLKRKDPVPLHGSWEAAMDERVEVLPVDMVMTHGASSAFFDTDLEAVLKARGIRNVIVGGVKTNYDVRATATDAMWRQFQAYVASDMVACDTVWLSQLHLEEMTKYTAKALSVDEIIDRIASGKL